MAWALLAPIGIHWGYLGVVCDPSVVVIVCIVYTEWLNNKRFLKLMFAPIFKVSSNLNGYNTHCVSTIYNNKTICQYTTLYYTKKAKCFSCMRHVALLDCYIEVLCIDGLFIFASIPSVFWIVQSWNLATVNVCCLDIKMNPPHFKHTVENIDTLQHHVLHFQ
jgi:hypothetical protein